MKTRTFTTRSTDPLAFSRSHRPQNILSKAQTAMILVRKIGSDFLDAMFGPTAAAMHNTA